MSVVLDWDGTVTETDALHLIILEWGDREIYKETEDALTEKRMTLHEVIAVEMATISVPLAEATAWVRGNVTVRAGFAEFARKHRPTILSSGFVELIEPVLEREGVELEVLANRLDPRPDGWRPVWRDEAQCEECGEACKRAGLPGGNGTPIVYVGDGWSDRCVALAADRVFARDNLARYLDEEKVPYGRFDDFRQLDAALAG